jgi:hypothetical protein
MNAKKLPADDLEEVLAALSRPSVRFRGLPILCLRKMVTNPGAPSGR